MTYKQTNIKKYALRKLAIGVASCAIGCAVVNIGSLKVYANTSAVATTGSAYDISDIIARIPKSKKIAERQFKKVNLSEITSIQEAIKKENPENGTVHISKMLDSTFMEMDVPINKLKETLQQERFKEYSIVMLDSQKSSYLAGSKILYLMKTDGRIVNSEEEYNQLVSELLQANTVENREIYAPFEFENSYIDLLLDGNGLGLAGYRNSVTINGINMYTGKLRLATSGESINRTEFSQLNRTIEDYANNDKKILELIYKSGALNKETEAERVQAWSDFIRKEFSYDIDALRDGGEDYNKASSIFSAVERKMAMCVGFSTLSARAYNMMGLRAYVVHGKRQNGSPHAITRVYFGNKWHFLDTTASIDGNRYAYLLDTYKEADTSALAGEMVIHRDFEKWLEKQRPRDILLVNNDVAKISPTSSVDSFAERTELQKMYDRVVFDIARYNYLITKLEEKASQPTSIISQSKDAVRELEMYRDDIDVSDKVVKSYLELLDWKIKVLENFAGQVEIGFEIPKFLEQRTANKEETILEKHISSNDSDEDSLHSEDERMSPQEDVQIKKVESTVEEVKELIVPESNGIEESRHNEENSELVENVPVLHESIPTNDNYSDVTLGTVQNIIFSLWNDVSSLFSSN